MKAVVQRVINATVKVDDEIKGKIDKGLLVYFCVEKGDEEHKVDLFAKKIAGLRIFSDENDKMNLNVSNINGSVLVISQFTLSANPFTKGMGLRPSFDKSESKERSEALYNMLIDKIKETGVPVECGVFGAHMEVEYINDGPVTISMDF